MPRLRLIRRTGLSSRASAQFPPHVAHQKRVALEVHGVHLGELRRPAERPRRTHQGSGHRVAFGREPVSLGHQARGGCERQAREAAVFGDGVEVRRVGVVAAGSENVLEPELHAGVILALLAAETRVDLEVRVLLLEKRLNLFGGDLLSSTIEGSLSQRTGRSERGEQRVDVDAMSHPVHGVAEDGHLSRFNASRQRREPTTHRGDECLECQSPLMTLKGLLARTSALAVS